MGLREGKGKMGYPSIWLKVTPVYRLKDLLISTNNTIQSIVSASNNDLVKQSTRLKLGERA